MHVKLYAKDLVSVSDITEGLREDLLMLYTAFESNELWVQQD